MALLNWRNFKWSNIEWKPISYFALNSSSVAITFLSWNSDYIFFAALGGLAGSAFSYASLPKPPRRREWLLINKQRKLDNEVINFELERLKSLEENQRLIKRESELEEEKMGLTEYKNKLWSSLKQQAQNYISENMTPRLAEITSRENAITVLVTQEGEKWQARVDEQVAYNKELVAINDALRQECNEKLEAASSLVKTSESRAEEYYRRLYGSVTAKHIEELVRPDFITPPGTKQEFQANEAIRALRSHGIVVKKPVIKQISHGFELCFEVLPKLFLTPTSKEKDEERLITTGEAIQIITTRCLGELMTCVSGCATKPDVEPIYNGIKLIFDTTGMVYQEEEVESANKIKEPPKGSIFRIFQKSYHLGFLGSTGRGKTTWTNNCLAAMCQELGSENIEIRVSAGKPDEELRKYNACVGFQKGLLLLQEAADLVATRLALIEDDYLSGKSIRTWDKKYIYFFDEITDLAAYYNSTNDPEEIEFLIENDFPCDAKGKPCKNIVGILLKRIWRLGRALGIMVMISGQNLNASVLGVQVVDLLNMGLIYLGTSSVSGIKARGMPTAAGQGYLNNQYALRIKAEQEFFALFCDAAGAVWFAELPAPGEYSMNPVDELPYDSSPPELLIKRKKSEIEEAIAQGIVKPAQLAVHIWGEKVNLQAAPYNSKNGLKGLLQKMVDDVLAVQAG